MTTRISFLLALLIAAVPVHAAKPVDDAKGTLAESQLESRRRAATHELDVDPLVDQEFAKPRGNEYDICIVPFKILVTKGKTPMVFENTMKYFSEKGLKVAPRAQVEQAIK